MNGARPRRRDTVVGVLLSYRESDAALRARNGTTASLVARGLLRAVEWSGRKRIPRPELERYALNLAVEPPARVQASRRRKPGICNPAALRALRVEDL